MDAHLYYAALLRAAARVAAADRCGVYDGALDHFGARARHFEAPAAVEAPSDTGRRRAFLRSHAKEQMATLVEFVTCQARGLFSAAIQDTQWLEQACHWVVCNVVVKAVAPYFKTHEAYVFACAFAVPGDE